MSSAKGLDDRATRRSSSAPAGSTWPPRSTTPCARPARCSSATTRGRTTRTTLRSPTTSPSPTTATPTSRSTSPTTRRAMRSRSAPSTVTVPAGGKATVPVTGDPQAAAIGRDAGWIVGTDEATGKAVTRTSVALVKEDERYDLNVSLVDRDGNPASAWVAVNLAGDPFGTFPEFVTAQKTLRLPPGDYSVTTYLDTGRERVTGPASPSWSTRRPSSTSRPTWCSTRATRACSRPRHRSAPRTGSARWTSTSSTTRRAGVPQRLRRPADGRRHLRVADGTRSRTGPSCSPRAGARARRCWASPPRRATSASTPSSSRVARWAPGPSRPGRCTPATVRCPTTGPPTPREDRRGRAQRRGHARASAPCGGGGRREGADRGQRRHRRPRRVRRPSPIPVASVHRDAGADLIALAQSGAKLTLAAAAVHAVRLRPHAAYPGHVPDQPLVYHPSKSDLARINARYYAVHGTAASGLPPATDFTPALGFDEPEHHPDTRVEWVTPGQKWVEAHAQNVSGDLPWPMVSSERTYHLGKPTRLDWFAPAIRPGDSDSFGVYNSRGQDFMTWNVQPWSSSSTQLDMGGFLAVRRDAAPPEGVPGQAPDRREQVQPRHAVRSGAAGQQALPGGRRREPPADVFRLSTRTHTEWRFMSDTVPGDHMKRFAVLNLDYRLETDLRGDVKAGAQHRISVRPDSLDGLRPCRVGSPRSAPGLLQRREHVAEGDAAPRSQRLVERSTRRPRKAARVHLAAVARRHQQPVRLQAGDHPGLRPAMRTRVARA